MAKIVDRIPAGAPYPWKEWFDGKARLLVRGTDFSVAEESFVSAARNASGRMGINATVVIRNEGVYIQAIK